MEGVGYGVSARRKVDDRMNECLDLQNTKLKELDYQKPGVNATEHLRVHLISWVIRTWDSCWASGWESVVGGKHPNLSTPGRGRLESWGVFGRMVGTCRGSVRHSHEGVRHPDAQERALGVCSYIRQQ